MNDPNNNADAAIENEADPVVLATRVKSASYRNADLIGHLVFLCFASSIILLSVLMSTDGKQAVFLPGFSSPLPNTCSSRRLLGLACPGCGLTRAFICISHGQLVEAWRFNHASLAIYLFVAIQIPWHAIQIWRIQQGRAPLYWPFIYWAPMAVAIILLTNWIWMLTGFH